jgi:hypothetical protein
MPQNTPRGRMSQKRRHHIFTENCTAHDIAPCCVCGEPIYRRNDRWIVEHVRPLALLGKDTNTNCAPAHYLCGIAKTAREARTIAKAKRQAKTAAQSQCAPRAFPESKRGFWKPTGAVYDWKLERYVIPNKEA